MTDPVEVSTDSSHRPRLWKGALVALLVGLVLFVGWLWQLEFDTPPYSEIRVDNNGYSFEIAPDPDPVTLPFVFDVSDVAANESSGLGITFEFGVVWLGVPEGERLLTAALADRNGVQLDTDSDATLLTLACDQECRGGGSIILTWPEGVREGEATVDMVFDAVVSFVSDSVPAGASMDFALVELPPRSTDLIIADESMSTLETGAMELVRRRKYRITATDSEAEYWLESDRYFGGRSSSLFLYVIERGRRTELTEGGSVNLHPPADCEETCSWEIELLFVDETNNLYNSPNIGWRIRQTEGDPAEVTLIRRPDVAVIEATFDGGEERIVGNGSLVVPVEASISKEDLPDEAMGPHNPQVVATLKTDILPNETEFPEDGRLDVRLEAPTLGSADEPHAEDSAVFPTTIGESEVVRIPAALECNDSECSLDLEVSYIAVNFDQGHVAFDWQLSVTLAYPFLDAPPMSHSLALKAR